MGPAGFLALWLGLAIAQTAPAPVDEPTEVWSDESAYDVGDFEPLEGTAHRRCGQGGGCGCSHCCARRLFGMLPSDACFDDFVSPLSNPSYFEDPRALTEARGIFIENSFPSDIGGGDAQVYVGQLRGRVTERLSVIAPRLAYFQANQSDDGSPYGFLSAPVGFKYLLYRDPRQQRLLSAGATYFIPGEVSAFSGYGSGDFHLFVTGGRRILGRGHWLSGFGYRFPIDDFWGTQFVYWSNQWDYELPGKLYPLFGVNWFHFVNSAHPGLDVNVTGLDLIDLPTPAVAGLDVVTTVAGLKWKPSRHFELGGGFEFPVSNETDILRNRVYADVIFRY